MSHSDKRSKKSKGEADGSKPSRRGTDRKPARTVEAPIPALRPVHAEPVSLKKDEGGKDDETVILLQDPEGFAPSQIVLSTGAYVLATFFNGEHTAREVAKAFAERYEQQVPLEKIHELAKELDDALFLEGPRFEEHVRTLLQRYLESPIRPTSQSGIAYPSDPDLLRKTILDFFTLPDAPGSLPPPKPAAADTLRGIMLPHIDLRVGGATYAHGYRALLEQSQADLFIILGFARHGPSDGLFNVSTKDFATPLGPVKTARGIARRLQEVAGIEPTLAEFTHKQELSIEYQAILLMALLAEHAGREFEIVPVLCGSIEPFIESKEDPLRCSSFMRFTEALQNEMEESKRRCCILASVELSHVGPKFGHSTLMTERLLLPLERADRRLLNSLQTLDPDKFFFEIARNENSRHVDAVLAMLTVLTLGKDKFKKAELLHYDQMLEATTKSAVSYASMAFE